MVKASAVTRAVLGSIQAVAGTRAREEVQIYSYLRDGEFPIDNNLAERTIWKLTSNGTIPSISAAMKGRRWRHLP